MFKILQWNYSAASCGFTSDLNIVDVIQSSLRLSTMENCSQLFSQMHSCVERMTLSKEERSYVNAELGKSSLGCKNLLAMDYVRSSLIKLANRFEF